MELTRLKAPSAVFENIDGVGQNNFLRGSVFDATDPEVVFCFVSFFESRFRR